MKSSSLGCFLFGFFFPWGKKLYLFMPCLTMFQPGAAAGGQAQTCSAATVPLLQAALCPPTHCMTQQFTVHRRRHSPSTGTSWQCAPWAPGQLPRWIFIWAWPISIIHFLSSPSYIILLILKWKKWAKAKKFDWKRHLLLFLPVLGRQRAEEVPCPACFFSFCLFVFSSWNKWNFGFMQSVSLV